MKHDQACFFDIAEAARLAVSYVAQTTKEEFLSDTKPRILSSDGLKLFGKRRGLFPRKPEMRIPVSHGKK